MFLSCVVSLYEVGAWPGINEKICQWRFCSISVGDFCSIQPLYERRGSYFQTFLKLRELHSVSTNSVKQMYRHFSLQMFLIFWLILPM